MIIMAVRLAVTFRMIVMLIILIGLAMVIVIRFFFGMIIVIIVISGRGGGFASDPICIRGCIAASRQNHGQNHHGRWQNMCLFHWKSPLNGAAPIRLLRRMRSALRVRRASITLTPASISPLRVSSVDVRSNRPAA